MEDRSKIAAIVDFLILMMKADLEGGDFHVIRSFDHLIEMFAEEIDTILKNSPKYIFRHYTWDSSRRIGTHRELVLTSETYLKYTRGQL